MVRKRKGKHKLTTREMLNGVRAAIRSRKTPKQFRPSLEKRERQLSAKLRNDREDW